VDAPVKLDIRLPSLLRWVLPPVTGMAAFGVLPTWLLAGTAGIAAEVLAVAVVLGVMIASGGLTVYAAGLGMASAVTVFLGCSLFRLLLCPALVGLVGWLTRLPFAPMGVWMIITYLACLGLESAWIVRALVRKTKSSQTENR